MATFTGTTGSDSFTKAALSAGVTADPSGSLPGDTGDTYNPDDGADIVVAGDGADIIHEYVAFEDGGNDDLSGGGGNDTIEGGAGADRIDGGADDDRLFGGEESPFGTDFDSGDTILGGVGADYLAGGFGADVLRGGDGDDKLFSEKELDPQFQDFLSDQAANRLSGGTGNDQLYGALGADRLSGGAGEDQLSGGAGDDQLSGDGDDDSLHGDAGDDRLNGGAGKDEIFSGDGQDTLIGGSGNDTIESTKYNVGSDSYVMSTDSVDGGKGVDKLVLATANLRIDLRGGVVTSPDFPGLKQELVSIERLQLYGADCRVIGSDGNDGVLSFGGGVFRGQGGNDLLQCDAGLLRGYGGDGKDTLVGSSGTDHLYGQDGNDLLQGRNGDDFLFGGAGNDRLYDGGGIGLDVLFGGAGNDRLRGDYFSDTLYGGAGRDRFEFTSWIDSKYERIDHIRGGAPAGGPKAGAAEEAFERPGPGKGDLVDVRQIDADDSRDGDQPFIFGSQNQGGLWLKNDGRVTVVLANVDRDDAAEFVLWIHDGDAARADDYTADDFLL